MFLFAVVLGCFGWQIYIHFRYFQLKLSPYVPFSTDLPAVSIVVAARNEAHNLPALLEALGRQDYPQYEIIIVDDRSEDETAQILASHKQTNLHIITIAPFLNEYEFGEMPNPKKNALQKAIAQSQYEWLLLTDADCLPPKDWILQMMQARQSQNTKIVLGIAPLTPCLRGGKYSNFLQAFVQYETFYTALQYAGFALGGKPYMGVGRNLLYHKSLFEQVGGFGKFLHITGGDDDLFINQVATKQNTSVALHGGFVYSHAPATWRAWFRQKLRHLSVSKHYKTQDQLRLALLYASQGGIWLGVCLSLLFLPTWWAWTNVGLFALRSVWVWQTYHCLAYRLGCKVSWKFIPLFDALFVPYLFIVGGLARFVKKVRWKP